MKIQSKICVIILSLLAGLMLMGSKEIMAAKNVTINDSTFPDLYFQEYILSTVDKNGDGKLSDAERKVIKVIDVGENSEYQLELEYPPSQSMKGIGNYHTIGRYKNGNNLSGFIIDRKGCRWKIGDSG